MVLPSLVESGPTGIPLRARTPNRIEMKILQEMHCDNTESLENPSSFRLGRGQIM